MGQMADGTDNTESKKSRRQPNHEILAVICADGTLASQYWEP